MGTSCSKLTCDKEHCNCFEHDKNVKDVQIQRRCKRQWIWTEDHQLVFVNSLQNYNVPIDLISFIKKWSYDLDEDYYVIIPTICDEKRYYSVQKKLLKKTFCRAWYFSQLSTLPSFQIGLHGADEPEKRKLMHSFNNHCLPSLKRSANTESFRTMHINECAIRVQLTCITTCKTAEMNLIISTNSDSPRGINQQCNDLWIKQNHMNNCILVSVCDTGKSDDKIKTEIAAKWNIPYMSVCTDKEKNVQDLVISAIKYYWFCNVSK